MEIPATNAPRQPVMIACSGPKLVSAWQGKRLSAAWMIALGLSLWACVSVLHAFMAQAAHAYGNCPSRITGRVLEACSCRVPCPCNFGPHGRQDRPCQYLAFFEFESGNFSHVELTRVRFALATTEGSSAVLYLDSPSDEATRASVRKIATWILSLEGKTISKEVSGRIDLYFGSHFLKASIRGTDTKILAEPLVGNDGVSNIVVGRPWIFGAFPVISTRKALAQELRVSLPPHSFQYQHTNANDAVFAFCPHDVK